MDVTPEHFRRLYYRMLEPKLTPTPRFRIKGDSDDTWGIVVTRMVISGVQVWHNLQSKTMTLGLTSKEMRDLIPAGAVPEGARFEKSPTGWFMYVWHVPYIDGTKAPAEQPAMTEVIQRVLFCFEWFRTTRSDRA